MLNTATFKGTAQERGFQHGERFAAEIRRSGIIEFYRDYCAKNLLGGDSRAMALLSRWLHRRCAAGLSAHARDLISGFARGGGFDAEALAPCFAMPDVLNTLIGCFGRLAAAAPTLGCTSVAAWGDYTVDGSFLYARNLDFPGNRIWDQFPLVARHKPDRGIPYVSLGAAGSVLDGITGINEEGVSVALHQHLSRDATPLGGRPILDLGLEALQYSRTIEDAVAICSKSRPTSAWTVVLTHWKRRRAALVEIAPSGVAVKNFDRGTMARANCYLDARHKEKEMDYPCWRESSVVRRRRAEQIIDEHKGRVDAKIMAGLLSDHFDMDRGRLRAFAQTIAQPHNMTSAVFEPEKGILWIADGSSPVCQGPYRKLSLWEDSGPGEALDVKDPLSAKKRAGFRSYIDGFSAWQETGDVASCLRRLEAGAAADPDEPAYRYVIGLLKLRSGDWGAAADSLGLGAAMPDYRHRSEAQRLWLARAHDLAGRRDPAQALYRGLETDALKPSLRRAAKKGLAQPYSAKAAGKIKPDFIYADVHRY